MNPMLATPVVVTSTHTGEELAGIVVKVHNDECVDIAAFQSGSSSALPLRKVLREDDGKGYSWRLPMEEPEAAADPDDGDEKPKGGRKGRAKPKAAETEEKDDGGSDAE